jgi:hypothetical protein
MHFTEVNEGNEEGTDKKEEATNYSERQVEPQRNRATEKEEKQDHGGKESEGKASQRAFRWFCPGMILSQCHRASVVKVFVFFVAFC